MNSMVDSSLMNQKQMENKYNKYKKKYLKLRKQLTKKSNLFGGGENIWIEDNFFNKDKFELILEESMKLIDNLNSDQRVSERQTLCLNPKKYTKLYDMIYDDPKFREYIGNISSLKMKSRPTYPIEIRKYPTGSKGMQWHKDLSLFSPDCYEVVLTLENTSDSKFKYDFINRKSLLTKANTLTIVKPNGVLHKVTPVNYGQRVILKFVVEFLDEKGNDAIPLKTFKKEIKKCPF